MAKINKRKDAKNLIDPFRYFDEEYKLPADITSLPPNMLRERHAYWGEQYVFCQGRVAYYEARVKLLEPSRKLAFNNRYIRAKTRDRLTNDIARMKAEGHKSVVEIQEQIDHIEINLIAWRSLTESCRTFMQLCSRDQSYREKEMDHYYKRGGQGR